MNRSPSELGLQTPASRALAATMSPQSFLFLQNYILQHSGIVLDEGKRYLVEAKLVPLLASESILSLDALCQRIAANSSPSLNKLVIETMTTNETLFFRDPVMFEALRTSVIPNLIRSVKDQRKLRIWSAASSTGQEAYSLAMLLLDSGYDNRHIEILATDLSEKVLEKARRGRYVQFEVSRGLPPKYLSTYFTKVEAEWQISKDILSMVHFQQYDLRSNLPLMSQCDLILCRNVLIYFNVETRRSILASLRANLAPGGLLVLGCAETVIGIDDELERYVFATATFYGIKNEAA